MVLLDTHVLAWMALAPDRLSATARDAIATIEKLLVSAPIAFEFDDLVARGRLPAVPSLGDLLGPFSLRVIDLPADCWRVAADLPNVHRDPVDRMLIAHALHADLPVVSADEKFARYPIRTIW